jgi:hypothetical protein
MPVDTFNSTKADNLQKNQRAKEEHNSIHII